MKASLEILPACFGTHEESHPDCDGDPSSDDAIAQKPCSVRGECIFSGDGGLVAVPMKETRIVPKTRKSPPRVRPNERSLSLHQHFIERVAKEMRLPWAPEGQAPVPGQLYEIDHVTQSAYATVYVRVSGTGDPLARLYFLTKEKKLSVGFPASLAEVKTEAKRAGIKGLKLVADDSSRAGLFEARTVPLDLGLVGACARLAARLHGRK